MSVARQPILDPSGKIFGYELMYRGDADVESGETGDLLGARVLTDAILGVGLDALTSGLIAFVPLTHHLLVDGSASLLPPGKTVLELRCDIPITSDVVDTCARLRSDGYALALDNFTIGSPAEALRTSAQYVKVNVRNASASDLKLTALRLKHANVKLIAEGVDGEGAAADARSAGYHLFQGFYFCRPTTFRSSPLPARRLAYVTLLAALNRPDVGLDEVEDLVKHDVSLSYRVLRSVNSAAFGVRQEVTSIRRALMLLGIAQIRKWASVWSLAGLTDGGATETVSMALVRARCCELAGLQMQGPDSGAYFVLGLCSLLDVILRQPMAGVLAEMPLPASIGQALLGEQNEARSVLDMVVAHEQGEWDQAGRLAGQLGLAPDALSGMYSNALIWAREMSKLSVAA